MPIQLRLFDAVTLNCEAELKRLMSSTCEKSGLSRAEIVCRMNGLARRYGILLLKGNGGGLTVATFEKWLNPNDTTHFPTVKALLVFCGVMGDDGLPVLNTLVKPLGFQVIGPQDGALLEWAREYRRVSQGKRRLRKLSAEVDLERGRGCV